MCASHRLLRLELPSSPVAELHPIRRDSKPDRQSPEPQRQWPAVSSTNWPLQAASFSRFSFVLPDRERSPSRHKNMGQKYVQDHIFLDRTNRQENTSDQKQRGA